jgi:hypothetical protein
MYINALEVNENKINLRIWSRLTTTQSTLNYSLIQQNAQSDPNYASLFRGRPKRFVMPLNPIQGKEGNLNTYAHSLSEAKWMNGGSCKTPQFNYNKYNGIYWNQVR